MDARGDQGMGSCYSMMSHHFQLLPDGGSIEVAADNPSDHASRDVVRGHMSQIAGMFSDTLPAGVETNETLKERDHLHGRVYSERSASQNYHRKLPKRSIEREKGSFGIPSRP